MKALLALLVLVLPLSQAQILPNLICPLPPAQFAPDAACTAPCGADGVAATQCSATEGTLCCPAGDSCRQCLVGINPYGNACEIEGDSIEGGAVHNIGDDCNTCVCVNGTVYCTDLSDGDCGSMPTAGNNSECSFYDSIIGPNRLTSVEMEEGICTTCICTGGLLFCSGRQRECNPEVCPDGSDPVTCFVDPCDVGSCPAVQRAECISNYCRGCRAYWFLDGQNVTERCQEVCPDGSNPVTCFVDPCDVGSCPAVQTAECRSNYCRGCRAYWFLDGQNVTERCQEETCLMPPTSLRTEQCGNYSYYHNTTNRRCEMVPDGLCGAIANRFMSIEECRRSCREMQVCPDGSNPQLCLADLCERRECPGVEGAICQLNSCDGCTAEWVSIDGDVVTELCRENVTDVLLPKYYESCPTLDDTVNIQACINGCSSNANCLSGQKCCSIGCSTICRNVSLISYYPIPLTCPPRSVAVALSPDNISCIRDCQLNSQCSYRELCCTYGCSSSCQPGQMPARPCNELRRRLVGQLFEGMEMMEDARMSPVVDFVPQCDEMGLFRRVQEGENARWCVNVVTGAPTSDLVLNTSAISCTYCNVSGRIFYPGQSFYRDCNTCWCSGTGIVACTLISCINPCSLPMNSGNCDADIESYYYDSDNGVCQVFSYGGCGGNQNRFSSVRDCLYACKDDSVCLLRRDAGERCDTAQERAVYYYNLEEGECQSFRYGGCGGNGNRFQSQQECLRTCDPSNPGPTDSTGVSCLGIQCDAPVCGEDLELVYNQEISCCPFCADGREECEEEEFQCRDGTCIPRERVCDLLRDCSDGEDEPDRCSTSCEFRCSAMQCIPRELVCDGALNCDNALDETNCGDTPSNPLYYPPVRVCPAYSLTLGPCNMSSCRTNSDCQRGLCCLNNCYQEMCTEPIADTPICDSVVAHLSPNASYVPQCTRDGEYRSLQCLSTDAARLCWCVNVANGIPFTETFDDRYPDCNRCMYNGSRYAPGERYTAVDGCNKCLCTVNRTVCTTTSCAPVGCVLGDIRFEHGETRSTDCIRCSCSFGQLNCTRRSCAITSQLTDRQVRVEISYTGSLSRLNEGSLDGLTREVIRTLLRRYGDTLNLQQSQITDIKVELMNSSVRIVLVISGSAEGADVAAVTSQLKQDYTAGQLIISYNNTALFPDDNFVSSNIEQSDEEEEEDELEGWQIFLIVLAAVCVVVLVLVASILLVRVLRKKPRSYKSETMKEQLDSEYQSKNVYDMSSMPSKEE